jgi:hypothetical protein
VRVAFSSSFCRTFEQGTERLLDEVGPRPGTQPATAQHYPTTALIQCDAEESSPPDRRRGIIEFGVNTLELPDNVGLPLILAFASYASVYSYILEYHVLDIQFPLSLLASNMYPGPKYGPAFINGSARTKLGVIIKPRFTYDLNFLEAFIVDASRSGIDYIIDDELTVGSHAVPFETRVDRIIQSLPKATGQDSRPAFIANIAGDSRSALARAQHAADLGADGVLVNTFTMGYDVIDELAQNSNFNLGIIANGLGLAVLTKGPEFRVSTELLVKLARLAGADAVYTGPMVGLIDSSRHSVAQFRRALTQPYGRGCSRMPAAAVMSGGIGLPELLRNDALYRGPLFLSIGYQFAEARLAGVPGTVIVDCIRAIWESVETAGLEGGRETVQRLARKDKHYKTCLAAIRAEEAVSEQRGEDV